VELSLDEGRCNKTKETAKYQKSILSFVELMREYREKRGKRRKPQITSTLTYLLIRVDLLLDVTDADQELEK
jgi:hypothetical protein